MNHWLKTTMLGILLFCMLFSSTSMAFDIQDMQGRHHQLSQYQGQWVVVNYWATWCPPCLEEIPDLVNFYDAHQGKGAMVIGVVFDYKAIEEVEQYVDDMLMSYPIVLGNDQVTAQIGPATVLPTTYIYNPQGELLKVKRGIVSRRYLESLMNQ